jgi:hypothetical protein
MLEVISLEFILGDVSPTPLGAFTAIGFIYPDGTVKTTPPQVSLGSSVGIHADFKNLSSANLSMYVHYKVTAPDGTMLLEGDSGNILLASLQDAGLDIPFTVDQEGNYTADLDLNGDSNMLDSWAGVCATGTTVPPTATTDTMSLLMMAMMLMMMGVMVTESMGGKR